MSMWRNQDRAKKRQESVVRQKQNNSVYRTGSLINRRGVSDDRRNYTRVTRSTVLARSRQDRRNIIVGGSSRPKRNSWHSGSWR